MESLHRPLSAYSFRSHIHNLLPHPRLLNRYPERTCGFRYEKKDIWCLRSHMSIMMMYRIMDALVQVPWLSHFAYKVFGFRLGTVGAGWAMARVKRGNSGSVIGNGSGDGDDKLRLKDLVVYDKRRQSRPRLKSKSKQKPHLSALPENPSEGIVAILGGSDMTLSVLACLFWLLIIRDNRGWYERVWEEVGRVFPKHYKDYPRRQKDTEKYRYKEEEDWDWLEELEDTKKRRELKAFTIHLTLYHPVV